LSNAVEGLAIEPGPAAGGGLERVADVPIYAADPVVRRAASLQQTNDAAPPRAFANGALIARLGLAAGSLVRVKQEGGEAVLELARDERVPDGAVRVAAAHASTAGLGAMFGEIALERV
ncbi:MAG: NADH-quinone oxidoreductase subunit NuoG, partial [Burkholderiales bacterium]